MVRRVANRGAASREAMVVTRSDKNVILGFGHLRGVSRDSARLGGGDDDGVVEIRSLLALRLLVADDGRGGD